MPIKRSILVITYWSFNDALIQTYTLPYIEIILQNLPEGSKIILVTLDKTPPVIPLGFGEKNIELKSIKYNKFGFKGAVMAIKAIITLLFVIKKNKVDTIHAWCTPGGMIATILSKISGKALILDSFEPHAESMVENGTWSKKGLAFKILFKFEKIQAKRAKYIIATTEGMKDYANKTYGHHRANVLTKPACVNLNMFSNKNKKNAELLKSLKLEDKIVCVYAGKLGGIYLEQEVFDFWKVAQDFWGDKFHVLLLGSYEADYLTKLANQSTFNIAHLTHVFVQHNSIPDYIGLGDFGITPVKPVPTKRYCSPIKNGEYWALGLPVVITKDISDDSEIIESTDSGFVLKKLSKEDYIEAINKINLLLQTWSKEELYQNIRSIAQKYRSFDIAKNVYKKIYSDYE